MARVIYTPDPVNLSHPMNDHCLGWWKVLPHSYGGITLADLMGGGPMTLTGMGNANNGWRKPPGGSYGHILMDGTAGYLASPTPGLITPFVQNGVVGCALTVNLASVSARCDFISQWTNNCFLLTQGTTTLGKPQFFAKGTNGTNYSTPVGATTMAVGTTYRLMGLVAGSTVYCFLNGALQGSVALGAAIATLTNAPVGIGNTPGAANWLHGWVDDIKIWGSNPLMAANPQAFASWDYEQFLSETPDSLNWL
jgi:hypothetical protein